MFAPEFPAGREKETPSAIVEKTMSLERIDDGFDYPPVICAHGWIVNRRCAWCGYDFSQRISERIKYDPTWDLNDDFDDDEHSCACGVIGCPECDADYYENFDCGIDAGGQCGKAGSEECDWECPFNT